MVDTRALEPLANMAVNGALFGSKRVKQNRSFNTAFWQNSWP